MRLEKTTKILIIIIAAYILLFSSMSIIRHNNFQSQWDLGISEEFVWNSINGKLFYSDDHQFNYLGNHFHLIYLIIFPLYYIFQSTEFMLAFQTIIVSLGAIIIFLLSKEKIKNDKISLGLAILYLLHPTIMSSLLFDYHTVMLSVPMLLLTFYFIEKENWKMFWISVVLTALIVEYIIFTILLLGIYLFLFKKRSTGIKTILISIVWIIILFQIIMPGIHPSDNYMYVSRFEYLGNSVPEIVGSIITNPVESIMHENQYGGLNQKIRYLLITTSYTGFLSLATPAAIIAIPTLIMNVFSATHPTLCYNYYYSAILVAIFFYSTILFLGRFRKNKLFQKSIIWMFTIGTIMSLFFGIYPMIKDNISLNNELTYGKICFMNHFKVQEMFSPTPGHDSQIYVKEIKEMISKIPKEASIISTFHIYSHTINHNITTHIRNKYLITKNKCVDEDYILYDYTDDQSLPIQKDLDEFVKYFEENGYSLIEQKGRIIFLKRDNDYKKCVPIKPLLS